MKNTTFGSEIEYPELVRIHEMQDLISRRQFRKISSILKDLNGLLHTGQIWRIKDSKNRHLILELIKKEFQSRVDALKGTDLNENFNVRIKSFIRRKVTSYQKTVNQQLIK